MTSWQRSWKILKQDKALAMIGLAQKAGKIVSGEFATEKAVKTGKAALVIVAGDASENTKKMFTNMCAFYEVPVYIYSDKETLGHAIGKQFRASLAVVDEGFRNTIEKHLKNRFGAADVSGCSEERLNGKYESS